MARVGERLPRDNWDKESLIGGVVDPVPQREVEAVVLASASPNVPTHRTFSVQANCNCNSSSTKRSSKMLAHLRSPVPGKYSPYLWKETVMTLSVV